MAMTSKGLSTLAKEEFEKKVRKVCVMTAAERCKTLVVSKKYDTKLKAHVEAVDGIVLDTILLKVASLGYETRKEFGADGKVSKLYLMKPMKEVQA